VKKRLILILTSIMIGCALMSGGYGQWEKKLMIRGSLTVVAPPPPPTPALTLIPSPVPYPEPSPAPDLIQENNQTDLPGNNETVETPSIPEPEEPADVLPQSSGASIGESTGVNGGDAAVGAGDTDTGAVNAGTAE